MNVAVVLHFNIDAPPSGLSSTHPMLALANGHLNVVPQRLCLSELVLCEEENKDLFTAAQHWSRSKGLETAFKGCGYS